VCFGTLDFVCVLAQRLLYGGGLESSRGHQGCLLPKTLMMQGDGGAEGGDML